MCLIVYLHTIHYSMPAHRQIICFNVMLYTVQQNLLSKLLPYIEYCNKEVIVAMNKAQISCKRCSKYCHI